MTYNVRFSGNIPPTEKEWTVIHSEIKQLIDDDWGPIGNLIFHDIGVCTGGQYNFVLFGEEDGTNNVVVSRSQDDEVVEVQPNKDE